MAWKLFGLVLFSLAAAGCKIGGTTWPQVWVEYRNMPPILDYLFDPSQAHAVSIEISNDENEGLWLEVRRNGTLLAFRDTLTGAVITRVPPKYTVKLGVDSMSSSWSEFHVSVKAWDAPAGGNVIGRTISRSYTIWSYQQYRYADTWSIKKNSFDV